MNDDDLTTDLGRALRDRSDAMHGTSLALADVQHKARSIRRRRTATAVGGAVAAIALIVPTAALANHHGRSIEPRRRPRRASRPPPARRPPRASQPPAGVLDVSDLPTGDAPRIDYVQDGTFHFANGDAGEVRTRYTPAQFVWLADGARVWRTTDKDGFSYVEIQDVDGTFHDPVRIGSDLSVNSAHSIVGLADPVGPGHHLGGLGQRAEAARATRSPATTCAWVRSPGAQTSRRDRQARAASSRAAPSSSTSADGGGQPWEVGESGSQRLLDGGYLSVSDVSDAGLSVGLTKTHRLRHLLEAPRWWRVPGLLDLQDTSW